MHTCTRTHNLEQWEFQTAAHILTDLIDTHDQGGSNEATQLAGDTRRLTCYEIQFDPARVCNPSQTSMHLKCET